MLVVGAPSESAYLLPMAPKSAYVTIRGSDITNQDALVFAPTRQYMLVKGPGEGTHAMGVTWHRSYHLSLLDVPDLYFAIVGAH